VARVAAAATPAKSAVSSITSPSENPPHPSPPPNVPRRPVLTAIRDEWGGTARTVLYSTVQEHWKTSLADLEADAETAALRAFIVAEVEASLRRRQLDGHDAHGPHRGRRTIVVALTWPPPARAVAEPRRQRPSARVTRGGVRPGQGSRQAQGQLATHSRRAPSGPAATCMPWEGQSASSAEPRRQAPETAPRTTTPASARRIDLRRSSLAR
jgi:hypothetical protein